jgi:hypothetical protein
MNRSLSPIVAALLFMLVSACSSTHVDLDAWRASEMVARPSAERGTLAADLAHVDALRAERRLADARSLALALAAEQPADASVLSAASRAESDALVMFAEREKDVRNAAAASAADFAERAEQLGATSAADRAQLAWALGASTHLRPMGERAAHAHRTLAVAQSVFADEPEQPTALATIAIVNLRLETLPWIAQVMASGLPESSLDDAVAYARRAVAAEPSRENRLVLAKCLRAAKDDHAARVVLEEALAAPAKFARDDELADDMRAEFEK